MQVMIGGRFGAMPVPPDGKMPCGCQANYHGITKWYPKCQAHDDCDAARKAKAKKK